jgi:hypothetical protein
MVGTGNGEARRSFSRFRRDRNAFLSRSRDVIRFGVWIYACRPNTVSATEFHLFFALFFIIFRLKASW